MDDPADLAPAAFSARRRQLGWWPWIVILLLLWGASTLWLVVSVGPPSGSLGRGPFELSVLFPSAEHGRFGMPVPVSERGYLALLEELDLLALSRHSAPRQVTESLQLYRLEPNALTAAARFSWESPDINSIMRPRFVTVDGRAFRPLNTDESVNDSSPGTAALRESRYGLVQLPETGAPLSAPLQEYNYSAQAFSRGGVLRGGSYFFLLRDAAVSTTYTLHALAAGGPVELLQQLNGVQAIGHTWHGDELTLALLDAQGALWRLEGSPPRFVVDESLRKLGSAALAAHAGPSHFCLASDFGVFAARDGILAVDRDGAQVMLKPVDVATSLPDGRKPGLQRKLRIVKVAKEAGIDPKVRNAAAYQVVEERAIALEGREAAADLVARGRLVLLDTDLIGVVDHAYQRVNLIHYRGSGGPE